MSRRSHRVPWAALAVLLACGESGSEPTPPGPEAGTVTLTLSGATDTLGAVSLRLVAPGLEASTLAFSVGEVHLQRTQGDTLSAAIFGAIGNQRLLTVRVADVRDLEAFTATVVEVASPGNTLLPTTGLQVLIARQ